MRAPVVAVAVVVALATLPACGSCRQPEPAREAEPASAPAAPGPAADSPGARHREALGRGRAHEVRTEWAAAAEAYREALAIWPDAPRAHAALSRSLLGAGDLPGALAAADEAVRRSAETAAAAEAHLARSRVLAKQGDAAGAAREVRRSHDLSPRAETRKTLGELTGKEPPGYLSPLPIEGPFADLAAACKARAPAPLVEGWACDPDKGTDIGINKVEPEGAPFAEARIFEAGTPARSDCVLAIRIDKRWWTNDLRTGCRSATASYASKDLSVAKPQGGGPAHLFVRGELTARLKEIAPDGHEAEIEDLDAFAMLCGVGPSKAPTCTPQVPIGSRRTTKKDGGSETSEYKLDLALGATGDLTLGSKDPASLDARQRELLGVHPLRW